MAKKNVKEVLASVPTADVGVLQKEYINSRGTVLILRSIPPYLMQVAAESLVIPKPPTYKVETASGDVEEHVHDEISVAQSDEQTQFLWAEYIKEVKIAETEMSELIMNIVLLEGVVFNLNEKEISKWISRQKLMGIIVPDDSAERELLYKQEYAVPSKEDIAEVVSEVMRLTGVSREEVESVKQSFQGSVESKTPTK